MVAITAGKSSCLPQKLILVYIIIWGLKQERWKNKCMQVSVKLWKTYFKKLYKRKKPPVNI